MEETSNVLFSIGPLEVSGSVVTMWILILVVTLFSILATRNMKDVPGKLQNVAELVVGGLRNYFTGTLGKELCDKYFPIFGTFFIFIIVSNYSGLLPGAGHFRVFHVPTANLSVTAGLAIVAFFTTHTIGIRRQGFGHYLLSFLKPFFLMLPLNLIEQVVRPFSLALRLYGNLYGEEMVSEQMGHLLPIGLPIVMHVLSLLFCLIQAVVFTMLLSIYISEATGEEE